MQAVEYPMVFFLDGTIELFFVRYVLLTNRGVGPYGGSDDYGRGLQRVVYRSTSGVDRVSKWSRVRRVCRDIP